MLFMNVTVLQVLILVVVEDGLGASFSISIIIIFIIVLILVVVEDGLGGVGFEFYGTFKNGLNPCCSGRWSRRSRC